MMKIMNVTIYPAHLVTGDEVGDKDMFIALGMELTPDLMLYLAEKNRLEREDSRYTHEGWVYNFRLKHKVSAALRSYGFIITVCSVFPCILYADTPPYPFFFVHEGYTEGYAANAEPHDKPPMVC